MSDTIKAWDFFGLAASDWVAVGSGVGGAILGAVVAGLIAAWLQKKSADHAYQLQIKAADQAERQAESERRAIARERAVRLMMRASLILVDLQSTVDALHRQLDKANRHGLTSHPMWMRVAGIVGSSRLQHFEVSELAPFLDARKFALVSRCVELGLQHEVLTECIARYNRGRAELKDLMPANALGEGLLFTPASKELLSRIAPHTTELDSLISQVKSKAEEQLERARQLNVMVGEAGEELFGAGFPRVDPTQQGRMEYKADA